MVAPRPLSPPPASAVSPRYFYRSLFEYLRALPGGAQRFWLVIIATGIAAGLAATGFLHLLRLVQWLAWPPADTYLEAIARAGAMHRVLVPAGAGVIVTILWVATRQKLSGHGTPGVIEAIWRREGRMSLARAFLRDVSSIIAVSMGASLGREGALIQTSAATGSWLADRLGIAREQARVVVACGAAAGIAAAYNVPIGASVFGLEVLLGSFALELFGPVVVCCVVATLVSRILVEDHPTYVVPHVTLMNPRSFILVLALGPLIGVVSALYVKGMDAIAAGLGRVPQRYAYALPIAAMAILGATAIQFPELLGNGYDTVDRGLLGQMPLRLLLILPLLKFLATALCSGAGVPGGMFTPSLYVGALLGGALGVGAGLLWPSALPSGAFALVGMGCVLAGTTHAAVSSVLIVFELTGNYDIILPVMLGCVLAAVVSRRIQPESIYTAALRRRNVRLPEHPRPEWLRREAVATMYEPQCDTIAPWAPFDKVVMALLGLAPGRDLYVIAQDGQYLGAIVLDRLKGHLPDQADLPMIVASDVMSRAVLAVTPEMPLSELVERFAATPLDKLPVVEGASGRLLGIVSKSDLLRRGRF